MDHDLREIDLGQTLLAWWALVQLRPQHGDAGEYVRRVDSIQRLQGYRLVGAFLPRIDDAVAVAGFRLVENLAWGRAMYVDDLITHPDHRGAGHAGALLDWVDDEATRLECDAVHLDSGHGRHDAHRLYLDHRFTMTSHHFVKPVSPPQELT